MLRRSQQYSLLNVTSFTPTFSSEVDASSRQIIVSDPNCSSVTSVGNVVDPEEVPVGAVAHEERLRKAKDKKKTIDACKMSCDARPERIPRCGKDEGDGSVL